METTRQQKIARLIQQDLGDIMLKEMKPKFGQSLITVTRVRISPDLSVARVHVSVYPIGNLPPTATQANPGKATTEAVMALIEEHSGDLRRRLGLREGKQLRIIPTLDFYLDDSLDYIENIDRLLKQ